MKLVFTGKKLKYYSDGNYNMAPGDTAHFSVKKAHQVLTDFPDDFDIHGSTADIEICEKEIAKYAKSLEKDEKKAAKPKGENKVKKPKGENK